MARKFIITAELRNLESQVAKGEISYSKMIEILNEKAEEYAKSLIKIHINNALNAAYDKAKEAGNRWDGYHFEYEDIINCYSI